MPFSDLTVADESPGLNKIDTGRKVDGSQIQVLRGDWGRSASYTFIIAAGVLAVAIIVGVFALATNVTGLMVVLLGRRAVLRIFVMGSLGVVGSLGVGVVVSSPLPPAQGYT